MTSQDLKIRYVGDASGVQKTLGSIDKSHASLASKLQARGKQIASMGSTLTRSITLPIVAGFAVAINEATEFRQVNAQTEAAIRSTGGAANVTQRDVQNLAAKIGDLSAQDAELVQQSQNVLLTFTKIRNETGKGNAIFDRASLAVANLSARMGTDLNSAALQVGKALNDPIAGLTSLTRAGVQFTDQQKAMITRLVEAGDTLGAQKIILKELETQFGGSAKAAGDAASPFTKLKLVALDIAESIGKVLLPVLDRFAGFVERLATRFEGLSPEMKKVVTVAAAVAGALGPVLIVVGKMASGLGKIIGLFARFGGAATTAGNAAGAAAGASGLGGLAGALGRLANLGGAVVMLEALSDAVRSIGNMDRYTASLEKWVGRWNDLPSALGGLGGAFDGLFAVLDKSNAIDAYNEATRMMTDQIAAGKITVGEATAALRALREELELDIPATDAAVAAALEHSASIKAVKNAIATQLGIMSNWNVELDANTQHLFDAYTASGDYRSALALLEREVQQIARENQRLTRGLDEVGGAMRGAETRSQLLGRGFVGAGQDADRMRGDARSLQERLQDLRRRLEEAGRSATGFGRDARGSGSDARDAAGDARDFARELSKIPGQYVAKVSLSGENEAINAARTLGNLLAAIAGTFVSNIVRNVTRMASGGVIGAASGIVTRPTVLTGEGSYGTRFGKGAEGVIPLTDSVLGRLGTAISHASEPSFGPRSRSGPQVLRAELHFDMHRLNRAQEVQLATAG